MVILQHEKLNWAYLSISCILRVKKLFLFIVDVPRRQTVSVAPLKHPGNYDFLGDFGRVAECQTNRDYSSSNVVIVVIIKKNNNKVVVVVVIKNSSNVVVVVIN